MQCRQDCFEDPLHVLEHIVIPEPQNAIASFAKPSVANGIPLVRGMLATI